jgi:hypothetical protein
MLQLGTGSPFPSISGAGPVLTHQQLPDRRAANEDGRGPFIWDTFSVSWPCVILLGGRKDPINTARIAYYRNLVDKLLENGIQPFVSLFHWDLPQALHDRYLGLLGKAGFQRLPKVKNWITLKEPWVFECSQLRHRIVRPREVLGPVQER